MHRQVAIKVIDDQTDDATSRVRLLREARNAAALNHPNICTIHEVDEAELPFDDVVRLGLQAADALAYAHDHGVVHRDFEGFVSMGRRG